ncbi:MAG TPA: DUF5666 domain-containing protein [Candidatus Eremiobacteraceae bacterium]|nr:DUF5666 domain-containing protein [Candidatus Eremiobacteraceae bacterium]
MRAYLAALLAAAGIFAPLTITAAAPALAAPPSWYYGNHDSDDNNNRNDYRQTSLTGCVLRVDNNRRFAVETQRGTVEVRLNGQGRYNRENIDLDDVLQRGVEVRLDGSYNGNGVYVADDVQRIGNGNRDRDDNGCGYVKNNYNNNNYNPPYVPQHPVNPYPNGQYPNGQYPVNGATKVLMGTLLSVNGGSLAMRSAAGYTWTVYFNSGTQVIDANSNAVGTRSLHAGEAITVAGITPSSAVLYASSIRIRSYLGY